MGRRQERTVGDVGEGIDKFCDVGRDDVVL